MEDASIIFCVLGTFPLSFERCKSLSVCLIYNFLSVLSNHRIFQSFISGGARAFQVPQLRAQYKGLSSTPIRVQ